MVGNHANEVYMMLKAYEQSTGACILYGISRVVIGENTTFVGGTYLILLALSPKLAADLLRGSLFEAERH